MRQPHETTLSAFFGWERQTPEAIFLRQVTGESIRTWTYREASDEVQRLAAALKDFQLPPATPIAILSGNCAHSVLADLAIMTAGCVSVPLSAELKPDEVQALLDHSGAQGVFLGPGASYIPAADFHSIAFPSVKSSGMLWDDCVRKYEPFRPSTLPGPDATSTIVYTPEGKGAVFTCGALGFLGENVKNGLRLRTPKRIVSCLPLHTATGRLYGPLAAISSGSSLSFGVPSMLLIDVLRRERPEVFVADPGTFSTFRDVLLEKYSERRLRRLISWPGIEILVKARVRRTLGLQRASTMICAGGLAPAGLAEWFKPLAIDVREAHGTTESGGYAHANFRLIRHGTSGQPWPWVEVRINRTGEILVRHDGLMEGYHNDPVSTKDAFTPDGFLRTGSRGKADAQGYLTLTATAEVPTAVIQG